MMTKEMKKLKEDYDLLDTLYKEQMELAEKHLDKADEYLKSKQDVLHKMEDIVSANHLKHIEDENNNQ